ncbi:MAG: nitroreductase family protein [Bacteriovoracaceae bacterium]|nr:nitroreductase family protein [Bacteriovoracaceae bacterium]
MSQKDDKKNVFTEMEGSLNPENEKKFRPSGHDYFQPEEFMRLVHARRSVRKFDGLPIPIDISDKCLEAGLLAPNSSNLQTWEFIRVISPEIKTQLAEACFSQSAARTASELIVCLARTDRWKAHCELMLQEFEKFEKETGEKTPKAALVYYQKLAPFVYNVGPFSLYSPLKWLIFSVTGLFRPTPREPVTFSDLKTWAIKSCALACENIMLAFRAYGYDTCPMEGYDSKRVKKILGLSSHQHLVMILGVGKAVPGGVYGPQIRFDKKLFIKTI